MSLNTTKYVQKTLWHEAPEPSVFGYYVERPFPDLNRG